MENIPRESPARHRSEYVEEKNETVWTLQTRITTGSGLGGRSSSLSFNGILDSEFPDEIMNKITLNTRIHIVLVIFSAMLIGHTVKIYLYRNQLIEEVVPIGCDYMLPILPHGSRCAMNKQIMEFQPRILYSVIHLGKLFEVQQFVTFPQKINMNSAGVELLQTLPGIGAKRAEHIVIFREQYGEFKDIADLKQIPGLHYSVIRRIEPYVQF